MQYSFFGFWFCLCLSCKCRIEDIEDFKKKGSLCSSSLAIKHINLSQVYPIVALQRRSASNGNGGTNPRASHHEKDNLFGSRKAHFKQIQTRLLERQQQTLRPQLFHCQHIHSVHVLLRSSLENVCNVRAIYYCLCAYAFMSYTFVEPFQRYQLFQRNLQEVLMAQLRTKNLCCTKFDTVFGSLKDQYSDNHGSPKFDNSVCENAVKLSLQ